MIDSLYNLYLSKMKKIYLLPLFLIFPLFLAGCTDLNIKNQEINKTNFQKTTEVQDASADLQINWFPKIKIDDLGVFTGKVSKPENVCMDVPDSGDYNSLVYYRVGTVLNGKYKGGEVILVTMSQGEGIGCDPDYFYAFRFLQYNNGLIFLDKYSYDINDDPNNISGFKIKADKTKFTIDNDIVIKDLELQDEITGANSSQVLKLFSGEDKKNIYNTTFLDDTKLSKLNYTKDLLIYYDKKIISEDFYIKAKDGISIFYKLQNPLLNDNLKNSNIIWDSTIQNIDKNTKIEFTFDPMNSCEEGSDYVDFVTKNKLETNLVKAGKINGTNYNVYVLKDENSKALKYLNGYLGIIGEVTADTTNYRNSILYFKDSLGIWIRLINTSRTAICGG